MTTSIILSITEYRTDVLYTDVILYFIANYTSSYNNIKKSYNICALRIIPIVFFFFCRWTFFNLGRIILSRIRHKYIRTSSFFPTHCVRGKRGTAILKCCEKAARVVPRPGIIGQTRARNIGCAMRVYTVFGVRNACRTIHAIVARVVAAGAGRGATQFPSATMVMVARRALYVLVASMSGVSHESPPCRGAGWERTGCSAVLNTVPRLRNARARARCVLLQTWGRDTRG